MNTTSGFVLAVLLLLLAAAKARVEPNSASSDEPRGPGKGAGGGYFVPGYGSFGIPGLGSVPGFSKGMVGGYGAGYGGPGGSYSRGGVVRPTVTCTERGPCYKKKLTCPARCFSSYSRSGKNYGEGGGGGGCTVDCKKKCVAYC